MAAVVVIFVAAIGLGAFLGRVGNGSAAPGLSTPSPLRELTFSVDIPPEVTSTPTLPPALSPEEPEEKPVSVFSQDEIDRWNKLFETPDIPTPTTPPPTEPVSGITQDDLDRWNKLFEPPSVPAPTTPRPIETPADIAPVPPRTTGTVTPGIRPTPIAFVPTGSMNQGRRAHTATLLNDGNVLVTGGERQVNEVEIYDTQTGVFVASGDLYRRPGHTSTLLSDGKVLIAGNSDSFPPRRVEELYDPSSGEFSLTGSLVTPRHGHLAIRLPSGEVLVLGGRTPDRYLRQPPDPFPIASAELYDPATREFSPTGRMRIPRDQFTATLLANGHVLVAGGIDSHGSVVAAAELYDPTTGQFTIAANILFPRNLHSATLLLDGRVLIAGGLDDQLGQVHAAELYDPSSVSFQVTGTMIESRSRHTASMLPDGNVLIAGGEQRGGDYASAEIFDPVLGQFRPSSIQMITQRAGHTATPLNDGSVLIIGGYTEKLNASNVAELFVP